jgi:hypothetical protein
MKSFEGLRAANPKKSAAKSAPVTEFGFLTVRLNKQDFKRFKRAAEDNNLTNQSGLVEAINRLMLEWGESPVTDHGSAGRK